MTAPPAMTAPPDKTAPPLRLGVNVDHVATIRNARGGALPDPVRAALLAVEAGADGVTAHLREDRRHMRDEDMARLQRELKTAPLNFEMAATDEMVAIALGVRPHACCLVPEKRSERTTEGGLDVLGAKSELKNVIAELDRAGVRVSLFIEPSPEAVEAARSLGAPVIELHTGAWCDSRAHAHADRGRVEREFERIAIAAARAQALGLECHAGHGLDYETAAEIAALPQIVELNIGHFLIGEAIFVGMKEAVARMRAAMDAGRARIGAK
jgi:pyridoxine 5-phosphate synthase